MYEEEDAKCRSALDKAGESLKAAAEQLAAWEAAQEASRAAAEEEGVAGEEVSSPDRLVVLAGTPVISFENKTEFPMPLSGLFCICEKPPKTIEAVQMTLHHFGHRITIDYPGAWAEPLLPPPAQEYTDRNTLNTLIFSQFILPLILPRKLRALAGFHKNPGGF